MAPKYDFGNYFSLSNLSNGWILTKSRIAKALYFGENQGSTDRLGDLTYRLADRVMEIERVVALILNWEAVSVGGKLIFSHLRVCLFENGF